MPNWLWPICSLTKVIFPHLVSPTGINPNRSALEFRIEPCHSTLLENPLPLKALIDTTLCIYFQNRVGAMPPKLMPFEYHYSTYQRIAQSFHKTSTRHYTNLNICTRQSTCGTKCQIFYKQFKEIRTCSRFTLSCLQRRRFLPDAD